MGSARLPIRPVSLRWLPIGTFDSKTTSDVIVVVQLNSACKQNDKFTNDL